MQTEQQKEAHVNEVFNNLRNFVRNDRGKQFPEGDYIRQHTILFIKKVLGYSNSRIFINMGKDDYATLLESWRTTILDYLYVLDQKGFNRYNGDDEHDLKETIHYIKIV